MRNLMLYEVVVWGGIGEMDVVFLVSATGVSEACELVCGRLCDLHNENTPDLIFEIAPDPRDGAPTVIIGPSYQFAYEYGWRKWERSEDRSSWVEVRPENP